MYSIPGAITISHRDSNYRHHAEYQILKRKSGNGVDRNGWDGVGCRKWF
jgi:hypothetical protein